MLQVEMKFSNLVRLLIAKYHGYQVAVLGEQGMLSEPQYELDVLMDTNSGNYRKLVYREGVFRGFILVGDTQNSRSSRRKSRKHDKQI
jgi:NAD(P)H-nitrite reductase large subunit